MTELDEFRAAKDQVFLHDPHSPLTAEQKASFTGLHYYPENPALRFEAEVERLPPHQTIQMQTSTGDVQQYLRYARFRFAVDDEEAVLTIYLGPHGYFLPFVDALAGSETYAAGRYVEPEELENGRFLIDFNYAYNPYCAYNEDWSCPLTPFENRVLVAIRAGERLFDK